MDKLLLSISIISLLIILGCSSPILEESNDFQMTLPTTEVLNQEVSDPNVEVENASEDVDTVETEERFTPDTYEDDNYVWMEGVY